MAKSERPGSNLGPLPGPAPDPQASIAALDELGALLGRQLGWQRLYSATTLKRAADYLNGAIHDLDSWELPERGGYMAAASIDGADGSRYATAISLQKTGAQWRVSTQCSCPVGHFCKHAAALMLMLETSAQDPLSEWESWIRAVESSSVEPPLPRVDAERRLLLILRKAGNQLTADPVWVRPMKRQGWGDAIPIKPAPRGPTPLPVGGWPPELEAPLTLLLANTDRYSYHQTTPISSRTQENALLELLPRTMCCWEKPATILIRGAPASLSLDWVETEDGRRRLAPVADGAGADAILLRGHQLWYINPREGTYGLVDGDPAVLDRLRNAPRVHPQQVDAVRERLLQVPRLLHLMTPSDQRPQLTRIETEPTAVLQLRALDVNSYRGRETYGVGRLLFDYAGHRIPPGAEPVHRLISAESMLDVRRSRAAENMIHELLADHQLQPAAILLAGLGSAIEAHDYLYTPRSVPSSVSAWLPLVPQLRDAGVVVEFDEALPLRVLDDDGTVHAQLVADEHNWFDLQLDIEVEGERIGLLPILRRLLADPAFSLQPRDNEAEDRRWLLQLDEHRVLSLPLSRLRAMIAPLLEWLDTDAGARPRLRPSDAGVLDALSAAPGVIASGGEQLRERARRLRERPTAVEPEAGFASTLRGYQKQGLAWLDALAELGVGGILADDMGLGKTVQVLAHLHGLKQRGQLDRPALVVCPTSLVGNWASEAERHAPTLRRRVIHGPQRAAAFSEIAAHDLVITTYPLLPRDEDRLLAQKFSLLILDEAQQIKNARTQAASVVRKLQAQRRLAMTGTPLENHLGELWAEFDAVEPGLLGSEKRFTQFYRNPIEKQADPERRSQLLRRIAPLMLRRRKQDVLADLPEKTEITQRIELEGRQRELYETLRLAQHQRVREAMAERGLAASGIVVLDALLKLRQVCCDPRLVKLDGARRVKESAKLDALLDMLDSLIAEGRRVLLFSQFTEMLELIATALDARRLPYLSLTGKTRGRAALVQRFQDGEVPIFLISLKAGGTGLNLTRADTVIHYDPWWNPAAEAQATDRAHRIGQQQAVFVYRLICAGTVEERIQQLQGRKAELARAVLEGGVSRQLRFEEDDIHALFGPG